MRPPTVNRSFIIRELKRNYETKHLIKQVKNNSCPKASKLQLFKIVYPTVE